MKDGNTSLERGILAIAHLSSLFLILFLPHRLVTVWSAPNYCYRCGNEAAILRLGERGEREMTVYGPAAENDTDSRMRERRQVRIQSIRMHEIEVTNCFGDFQGKGGVMPYFV